MKWRFAVVLLSTCLFLGLIASVFWHQDRQYSLPTTRPAELRQPAIGERLAIVQIVQAGLPGKSASPILLHFFNPDCPCSRFNLDHIRHLSRRHRNQVRFVAVLSGEGGKEHLRRAFEKLGLGIESFVDEDGVLGRMTGVYATPQAVLLDPEGRLYYRGNYNLSRYCSAPETEFARIALESLLAGRPAKTSPPAATAAYGCPLRKRRST